MRHSLYKYFTNRKWVDAFLDGEIFFNSLAYFRDYEDGNVREDKNEGNSVYRPEEGLLITNHTQGKTFTMPVFAFESTANQEEIFVFCVSRSRTDDLRTRFNAVACVEIFKIQTLCTRIARALPPHATFRANRIDYYDLSEPPNPRWALPDQIAMSKFKSYACVPIAATRQISREVGEAGFGSPILLDFAVPLDVPNWVVMASDDSMQDEGGPLREFLWLVADEDSSRSDFAPFVRIYDSLERQPSFSTIVELTSSHFPRPSDGRHLKKAVLGEREGLLIPHVAPKEILFALATTEHHESFNGDELALKERACRLLTEQPTDGCLLVGELLRASLNPIGEEILKNLILAMSSEDALAFATGQHQFLPTLVRVNPKLATSAQLWRLAGDHKRELFESVAVQPGIAPELLCGIIDAMLDSESDGFIRRAFSQWGRLAIFEALDWSEARGDSLTQNCRAALSFHVSDVTSWIATGEKSTNILAALAYVVAPYASRVAQDDTKVWLHTLHTLRENHRKDDADYVAAFLFALALCDAPPAPLDLVSESFERVHWLAEKQQLRADAWSVLEPFVPELNWGKNWDRCERMRRALMAAFMRYDWPPLQLRELVRDQGLIKQLLKSARKVGAEHYFQGV